MSVLYQYQIDGTVHYAASLQDARKALAKSYRETGTIRMQCVLMRCTVAGFVHPINGELYWVVNKNGVDMYTKLGDDGNIHGDTTDVPPGETPSFYIEKGPAFKWLETARRYLALYFPKDWQTVEIHDRNGDFVEEHVFDGNGHHYITLDEFTQDTADHRTYYKANKIGFPTNQTYDDWKIGDRCRKERCTS